MTTPDAFVSIARDLAPLIAASVPPTRRTAGVFDNDERRRCHGRALLGMPAESMWH